MVFLFFPLLFFLMFYWFANFCFLTGLFFLIGTAPLSVERPPKHYDTFHMVLFSDKETPVLNIMPLQVLYHICTPNALFSSLAGITSMFFLKNK